MIKPIKIRNCLLCGSKGYLYFDYDGERAAYFLKCEKCGYESLSSDHLETAIANWNDENLPRKMKPTYHCRYCDAEIHLGFTECPKCKTEIDWE